MPKLSVTHLEATLLFALFSSIVLGIVTRKTDHERLRYGIRCFAYFVVALFAVGWVMYLAHG